MMQEALTEKIIGYFYKVYNTLGFGFLEKVYESALGHELRKAGLLVESQTNIKVFYDGITIGDYFADLSVEETVIVEFKASEALRPEHEAQLVNYLRATKIEVGLLFNFGQQPEMRRKIYENRFKRGIIDSSPYL